MKPTERYVRICPACGSIDVHTDFSNPVVWADGTRTMYECNRCGNMSVLFPEVLETEIGAVQKEIVKKVGKVKKQVRVDTGTGYFVAETFVLGVLSILGLGSIVASLFTLNDLGLSATLFLAGVVFLVVAFSLWKTLQRV